MRSMGAWTVEMSESSDQTARGSGAPSAVHTHLAAAPRAGRFCDVRKRALHPLRYARHSSEV